MAIRTRSTAALTTVNPRAVIQEVWTSGSAMPFGDDSDVVGMAEPAVGPGGDPAHPGTTMTRVFHWGPRVAMHHQRRPCEAIDDSQHRPPERGHERPAGEQDLDEARDQQRGVQGTTITR